MWSTLVDNWLWFLSVLTVAFLARQFRLYVLRKKKDREEKKPEENKIPFVTPAVEVHQDLPADLEASTAPPPAPVRQVNEVEAYYAKEKAAWEKRQADAEHLVALANQKAQFEMVEHGKCIRLTIHDPDTVESLDKLTVIEEILDNEKDYVVGGCVKIIDKRPATPKQWLPKHARAAAEEAEKRRQTALRDGELFKRVDPVTGAQSFESVDRVVQDRIDAGKDYSAKIRERAKKDFKEVLPEVRANAEKIARERFVSSRMPQFTQEAADRGCDVKVVIDEFVMAVGDDAVKAAETRFSTPQPLTNDLFMRAVDADGWRFDDPSKPKPHTPEPEPPPADNSMQETLPVA